jgi:site-specific DNA recombinase
MPNSDFFKPEFDKLATNGCIGDMNGQIAYAYIRVSDESQSEEGRSGLPRQIEHVHQVAKSKGFKIPWEMVFADDHTGFQFEGRPALTRLRHEYNSVHRRASVVVMEHIDRLSRDADWHQGYLLFEMNSHKVLAVFWKEFSSRIERAVLGAVAQEGMDQAKHRMLEGNLYKARSGRVTARSAAYGYKLVDAYGNEGASARKDSYYAIREDEAQIVRLVYRRLIGGDTMRKIATELEKTGIRPPKKSKYWTGTLVRLIIKNEIYQGDFFAHRWEHTHVQKPTKDGFSTRNVYVRRERPREEWIHVPIPAIVSREEWDTANRMLAQNKRTARRNAKEPFLLTGLVRCAVCGYRYTGLTHRKARGKLREKPYRGYRCSRANAFPKHIIDATGCKNGYITCKVLDTAVWTIVCDALLKPQILIGALEEDERAERNAQLQEQIAYLEHTVVTNSGDDEKLLRAYLAGAFDEQEYAGRRKLLKDEAMRINDELIRLRSQVTTVEQLEARQALILQISERIQAERILVDPPFELKQRIIRLVVDDILLDIKNGWIKVEGAIRGTFPIVNSPVNADTMATQLSPAPARQR